MKSNMIYGLNNIPYCQKVEKNAAKIIMNNLALIHPALDLNKVEKEYII